jgi:hypothetical protein
MAKLSKATLRSAKEKQRCAWMRRAKEANMPRIRQYADKYLRDDLLREIDVRCAWNGIKTNKALGDALGVTDMTIGNFRREPGARQIVLLQKMVKVLKPNPGPVLMFLGYSEKEIKKFAKEYLG